MKATLMIGANSAIAIAASRRLIAQGQRVISISRCPPPLTDLHHYNCDYSDESIMDCCLKISKLGITLNRIFHFNGMLHQGNHGPEKQLSQCQRDWFNQCMSINAFQPLMWLQQLQPLCHPAHACVFYALSARLASISDNQLGGWYSYRASKAALNMLMKTAAIEVARRQPKLGIVLWHPGTTDSPLSRPFQTNVAKDKLFTPAFSASQLLKLAETSLQQLTQGEWPTGQAQFIDWQGEPISW
ncbi:SDR family NAD(P)-dependent oxidoreductase [Shewanella sp. NIFS-20-20]|uniref:SDR family NAD(P)-dependent oxidoreductase n=1 Tax=Shewanella sp. NIFS-20-20 TaxID=2853806 RepID=UPI001C47E947|nr:SDR family NAD(P)-dependent oxidoreductase [Shewanella sp. NIFS-20-20]MBV7316995.1 SDR family NAD(P)-dependent oxidoreductase [Shewanella sp. NIFS-20-20]